MEWQTASPSEAATRALGEAAGRAALAGDVLALSGPLGAGKTVFAQGVLAGLGCPPPYPSPTFTLVRTYEGCLPAVHVDLYRLAEGAAGEDLGWEELLGGERVAIVEWAEYLLPESLWPADRLEVHLARPAGRPEERQVRLVAHGASSRLLAAVREAAAGWPGC